MATIRIKNLGPIKDTGLINLTDLMLVIGRQSSGKSTFMKVLCYCRWIEKKIMTSFENTIQTYTHNKRFLKELKQFHRVDEMYLTLTLKYCMMEMSSQFLIREQIRMQKQCANRKLGAIDIIQNYLIYLLKEILFPLSVILTAHINQRKETLYSTSYMNGMRQR